MSPAAMFVDGGVSRYSYKNRVSETHKKERAAHVFNPPRQANISVALLEVQKVPSVAHMKNNTDRPTWFRKLGGEANCANF